MSAKRVAAVKWVRAAAYGLVACLLLLSGGQSAVADCSGFGGCSPLSHSSIPSSPWAFPEPSGGAMQLIGAAWLFVLGRWRMRRTRSRVAQNSA